MNDNELIARFMGWKILAKGWYSWGEVKTDDTFDTGHSWDDPNLPAIYGDRTDYPVDCMKFHTSWDWLMPVVEKIDFHVEMPNGDYFQTSIGKHKTSIFRKDRRSIPYLQEEISSGGEGRLKDTYETVIQFIKWYNENRADKPTNL
jgi:hypothetical protein